MQPSSLLAIVISFCLVASIAQAQPATPRFKLLKTTVAYREVDGHKVLADIYRPAGDEVRPVIVWIHGGALIMGSRSSIHPQIRTLAEQKGYAVVSIDYRLAPETKLPELISDIEAAFKWLSAVGGKQFHLDANRIVVAGGSAGGYLTLVTGYRVQPRPKALVALYGYGDLNGEWYSKPSPHPRHNRRKISRRDAEAQTDGTVISDARQRKGNGGTIYLYYRQNGIWPSRVSGFSKSTIAEQIAEFEPQRNVTAQYPPTLLIHGTKDTDVPFQQSTMMAERLKQNGVPFVLKPIDNGEHGFGGGDPKQINAAYQTMREFIVKHLEAE
jgi:acetyl esterase/lipase